MTESSEDGVRNSINPKVIESYFNAAKDKLDELASLKGTYMADCKPLQEDLKDIKVRAKDSGIPMKVFNAGLKRLKHEAAIAAIPANLDEDNLSLYEYAIDIVLGDYIETPLGQAAAEAEKAQEANGKPKGAKRKGRKLGPPRSEPKPVALSGLTDDDADQAAALANAERLNAGISTLN